jgi:hypothetical protein
MGAVPRRLKRIEVYCPEYKTTATIRINDAHSSGTDHLEVDYRSPDHSHFTIAIPDHLVDTVRGAIANLKLVWAEYHSTPCECHYWRRDR